MQPSIHASPRPLEASATFSQAAGDLKYLPVLSWTEFRDCGVNRQNKSTSKPQYRAAGNNRGGFLRDSADNLQPSH